jgi:16S rRNA (cytidine1402-2'-O)-methyltransferase
MTQRAEQLDDHLDRADRTDRAAPEASEHAAPRASGRLYVVGTPIGNLEDITLRALRILGSVPVLAAEDTRAAQHLLGHHRVRAQSGPPEIYSFFAGNEAERTAQILQVLAAGRDVALISEAGLPSISDPGQRLVEAARRRGIPVEVVPGPSASLTALVGSGLPTSRFLFVGFPPRAEGERLALFGSLRHEPGTILFYESAERVHRSLGELARALGDDRPACVARELTKRFEELRSGTLAELHALYADAPPRGEVTLVVAGRTELAADAEHPAGSDSLSAQSVDVETEIRRRLATGQGPKEIATSLTLLTGQPRRKLYQLALLLKERG